jgi:hypothetical protein
MNPGPRCGGSVAGALNLRNQAFAGRRFGLVLGDVAALQDEFADGKQEKKDKNGVEFGGEESVDHEQFSLSPAWFCVFHDLAGEFNSIAATQLIPLLDPPARNI